MNDYFDTHDGNDDSGVPFYEEAATEPVSESGKEPNIHPAVPTASTHKKSKKKKIGPRLVAVALCSSILGGILGAGGVLLATNLADKEEASNEQLTVMVEGRREQSTIKIVSIDTSRELTATEVYAANVGSTVGITTTSVTTNFWGYQTTSAASGSGFIISTDGYILTNYHVIEDASSVKVAMYDGTVHDASLIGYDESNDIAVLKVDAEDLTPVILGDSDNMNVGDSVVAIGNPLGELTFSLTSGAISAMDREVTLSSTVTMNLLQTDCAINSGNSGGALFNMYGEVIGVTNAKYSSSSSSEASIDNIGFAIPINSIRPIVESIIEKGYISSPYIGISVLDVSAETQLYGIPAGIAIQSVTAGSPAEEAGLQVGDVVTSVDGTAMTSSELVAMVESSSIGDSLVLSIYRQGQTMEITVVVGEKIQSALANEEAESSAQSQSNPFSQQGGRGMNPFGGFGGRR